MGKVKARRRRQQGSDGTSETSSNANTDKIAKEAVAEAELEERKRRRTQRVLHSPVPLTIIVGLEPDKDDGLCLSLIQTLIDRRTKLLQESRRKRSRKRKYGETLNYVVMSHSKSAVSIALEKSTDGKPNEKIVSVLKLEDNYRVMQDGAAAHFSFLKNASDIVSKQLSGSLGPRLHGIFVHICADKNDASCSPLRAILQSCFMEESQSGIKRLDVQGVVVVVRPEVNFKNYSVLMALADRIVLAIPPKLHKHLTDGDSKSNHFLLKEHLERQFPRAEIVEGTVVAKGKEHSKISRLLILDPHAAQCIDEIFAYSRFVVTQIFTNDDDMRRPRLRLLPSVEETSSNDTSIFTALLVLPDGASVELEKFQFWLESYFLAKYGAQLLRIKGLLAARGSRHKFVLQGTGMSYGMEESGEEWWNQTRRCTILIVGTEPLDKDSLMKGLLNTCGNEGYFEAFYWWADSHCCLMVLMILLFSTLSVLAMLVLMDYGFVPSILPWV